MSDLNNNFSHFIRAINSFWRLRRLSLVKKYEELTIQIKHKAVKTSKIHQSTLELTPFQTTPPNTFK